jgi:hypothetical protein
LRQAWDDTRIFGCRFHLTQSWYRKIQELGPSNVYQNNKAEESKWLNHIYGLLFISLNEFNDCFIEDFMSPISNDIRFKKYADYIIDTYVSEETKFPPIIWAANIASQALITNACESYHSHYNSKFFHLHFTIYHFLDVLKGFSTETLIKIKSIHLKKQNYIKNENRLKNFQ